MFGGVFSRIARRARAAYQVFKGEPLPFGWKLLDTTTVTLGGKIEVPPSPDELLDTYARDLWVNACLSAKGTALSAVPFALKRTTKDGQGEVVSDHPVMTLLERPSPRETWETFVATVTRHLDLTGSAFVEKVRAGGKNKGESPVKELRILLPTRMRIVIDPKKGIEEFRYKPNEREQSLSPDDVMHFRLPDPRSEVRGLGAIEPAWQSVRVDREAARWNASFFERGAYPGVTLQTNAIIAPAERDRLRAEWNTAHQGTSKAHGVAILPYGLTAAEFGLTHREMQFRDLRKMTREELHAVLRVPPILTGLLEYSAFATAFVQLALFRDYEVLPRWNLISSILGWDLFLEFQDGEDLYVEADRTKMQLPDEVDRDLSRAVQLFQAQLVDRDEARAMIGLMPAASSPALSGAVPVAETVPADEGTSEENVAVDEGRESTSKRLIAAHEWRGTQNHALAWFQKMQGHARMRGANGTSRGNGNGSSVTVVDSPVRRAEYGADVPTRKAEELPQGDAADDDGDAALPRDRISTPFQLQKARDRTVSRLEPALMKLMQARLDAQKAAILALIKRKVRKDDDDEEDPPAQRVDVTEAQLRAAIEQPLTDKVADLLSEGLNDGGEHMADLMRVDFLRPEKEIQDYIDERRTNLERVLDEDTARMVKDSLRAGYDAGETERQLLERLAESGTFAASRAQRIARTELHTATQAGAHQQMVKQGVRRASWLAAPDARKAHAEASGQVADLDDGFNVGGEILRYPGDPDGSPENTINCRCVLLTEVRETSEAELSDLLDSLGVKADAEGVEGQVSGAVADLPKDVTSRIDPEDVAPLRVSGGRAREVEYEPASRPEGRAQMTVGPKASKAAVQDGVKEHLVASVTTRADARGLMNVIALQDLPDVSRDHAEWSSSERKRAVALVSRAATGNRAGLDALVGRKLTDAEWARYETVARNFWMGVGTKGPLSAKR